ncbi:MAG TPA: homocysteine S-methyltransferase family protein [Paracoccaceae bacterium]|nr:homocysteine S-methyltransferase family protein [Paracoccaceae bacterium]
MALTIRQDADATLPQLRGGLFLSDGGIETSLIYLQRLDLPYFAAFPLLRDAEGRAALRRYYQPYLELAARMGTGFILETPTWRASQDWGTRLGYTANEIRAVNRDAVALTRELREAFPGAGPVVISGCVGPRGDGYVAGVAMTPAEAAAYHGEQIGAFAEAGVNMVTAITMTYAAEAIGIVRAARLVGLPAVISFTVETDGRLPSGQPLGEAIEEVDAATGCYAAYFMVNCAHPDHFATILAQGGDWAGRIRGIRANASRLSHAELDAATELDPGDPEELAALYAALRERLPHLNVFGGCCGTDHRHVGAIARSCVSS